MTVEADTNTVLMLSKKIIERNKESYEALGKQNALDKFKATMEKAEQSVTEKGTVTISQLKEDLEV